MSSAYHQGVQLLHLVRVYHLLDHTSADRACLTRCEVAVVALLEVYAELACGLHLESLEGFSALLCHFAVVIAVVAHFCFLLRIDFDAVIVLLLTMTMI